MKIDVIIGTPINSQSAYALDEFITNQKEIHRHIHGVTVLATEEIKFYQKMKDKLPKRFIILHFSSVEKKDRVWNIAKARNVIRNFFINRNAKYLCFMDGDMIFDPEIINHLIKKAEEGYDVVYNIYKLKNGALAYSGFGGTLIKRWVAKKLKFRCIIENNLIVDEVTCFKKDLFKLGARIFRGIMGHSIHLDKKGRKWEIWPRKLRVEERIVLPISDFLLSIMTERKFIKLRALGRRFLQLR